MGLRRVRKAIGIGLGTAMLASGALALSGATPVAAEEPTYVGWSDLLPGLTTAYDPSSANDCTKGKINCVRSVIREMTRRFDRLAPACDHDAVFSLTYLRTTEQYLASVADGTFFRDTEFVNHQDAVFARYYFDAFDAWHRGDVPGTAPSWQVAFDAADRQTVSGAGNLLLGMSSHVNRDLAFVLADIGLVRPDGSSRKDDHDKVNEFLNLVMEPLLDEAAARFDPSIDDGQIDGTTLDETALLQILVAWREGAWRNAERLVSASTPAARAAVAADIERQASMANWLLIATFAYSPTEASGALSMAGSLGATTAQLTRAQADRAANAAAGLFGSPTDNARNARNAYCAAHWAG